MKKYRYKCKECGYIFIFTNEDIDYVTDFEEEEWHRVYCPNCHDEIIIDGYGDFRGMQKFKEYKGTE